MRASPTAVSCKKKGKNETTQVYDRTCPFPHYITLRIQSGL